MDYRQFMPHRPGSRLTDPTTTHAAHAALAQRIAQDRDQQAFVMLYDFYTPRLTGMLLRQGLQRDLAEDIVQDTMATLWHKAGMFDASRASLSTWLYRIARNRRIDLHRRVGTATFDPSAWLVDLAPDATDDAESGLDESRRQNGIGALVKALPEEQSLMVQLAFYEGLTHAAIAERTHLPLGTVKSRLRLAFVRLRRAFDATGLTDK